jgi:DinB superfamily
VPITPDAKNWTWVLDRPCSECGFEAAAFPRENVGRMIRDNAAAWRLVLARPDVARRANENMWSPLEYACHVRDVFRICDGRLALMLAEDDPTFANWDQDATAVDDAYGAQYPARVGVELDEEASRFADRFDGVEGGQWSRPGTRSDGSIFTVESFARYVIHDPIHHLFDIGARVPGK